MVRKVSLHIMGYITGTSSLDIVYPTRLDFTELILKKKLSIFVQGINVLKPSYHTGAWAPGVRGHRADANLSAARVRGPALCPVYSLITWEMHHMTHS